MLKRKEQWDQWMDIPKLKLRPEWDLQMVPPFGGMMARFWVFDGEQRVSVYFDVYDRAGSVGVPYWEIYPDADGDCSRFLAKETSELTEAIAASFAKTA